MRMDDEELLVIAHSQDYRPEARRLAKSLLLRRQVPAEAIEEWRDPTADLTSVPWALGKSEAALRRMFRHRRLLDRAILWLPVAVELWDQLKGPSLLSLLIFLYFFVWYLALFRPILHVVFYWRTPLRVLFLRPFEFSRSRARTRRFARRYLRYLGHTYTLTDSQVKKRPAFFESLQFLLSFMSLWAYWLFRPYFHVKHDEDVRKLKEFINRRLARNVAWILSWDKLFKISCTPDTWKRTVQHLINSAQLIVVDVSHDGQGLRWELDEMRFYGATGKTVFVCHEDCLDSARTILDSYGDLLGASREMFLYRDKGLASKHEDLSRALACVAASAVAVNNTAVQAA